AADGDRCHQPRPCPHARVRACRAPARAAQRCDTALAPNAANSSLAPPIRCSRALTALVRRRSPTTEDTRRLLRRVSTGLGDLAILTRGCAGGTDGPDNLAIRDERNAALQRRGSA